MHKPFKFKQFTIQQDRCAMKIGTDGVLLGAWTPLENNPSTILDVGAGTGLIALMLAQRSNSEIIDAIEIDDDAYEQCVENFEAAPWNDRLFCYHASLEEFADEIQDKYDLIVSNPPFYSEDYKTQNNRRNMARFADALPFDHLLESVSKLLSETGTFSVVIPFKEEEEFLALAKNFGLFPTHRLHVKGQPQSNTKRSLMAFSFRESDIKNEALIIETSRHVYTDAYRNLAKDFYLRM